MKKTNAIRLLEQAGIDYEARMYPVDESDLSGTHAAAVLGLYDFSRTLPGGSSV